MNVAERLKDLLEGIPPKTFDYIPGDFHDERYMILNQVNPNFFIYEAYDLHTETNVLLILDYPDNEITFITNTTTPFETCVYPAGFLNQVVFFSRNDVLEYNSLRRHSITEIKGKRAVILNVSNIGGYGLLF